MATVTALINTHCIFSENHRQEIHQEKRQPIYVVFTSLNGTQKALEKAVQFMDLSKHAIEVVATQSVPYALPLEEPPVPLEVLVGHLKEIAEQFPQIRKISAYLCRDELEALKQVINIPCPIIMGIRKTLLPDHDKHLAQKLRHAGFDVILIEME